MTTVNNQTFWPWLCFIFCLILGITDRLLDLFERIDGITNVISGVPQVNNNSLSAGVNCRETDKSLNESGL